MSKAVGLRARIVPWLLTPILGAVLFMPICDLSFDCGCVWPGMGGMRHCDIQTQGPPDCPWCLYPWSGYAAMAFSALAGLIAVGVAPRRFHWSLATLVGLAGFFVAALLAGVLTAVRLGLPVLAGL